MNYKKYDIITILGCTATGKTKLAANLAAIIDGEIISADSRQVYKNMDIGTGKDLNDYIIDLPFNIKKSIDYHLINIVEPGYEYNVFEFKRDFDNAYNLIKSKNKTPILCGGTGLYIEAVLSNYNLTEVHENIELRNELALKNTDDLIRILSKYRKLHNSTDIIEHKRLIRAIEIEKYYSENNYTKPNCYYLKSIIFGINMERDLVKQKITKRLNDRLNEGMIDEVRKLIESGVSSEKLKFYGLEYKYITQYILKEISYNQMFTLLNTAIHQFSKRQMTWFRRMEKKGFKIIWIDGNLTMDEKINSIKENLV